jgi:membrane protein
MKCVIDSSKNLYKAARLFHHKHGMTLASSSSFYAIITAVPFLLLLIRGIGYFLGNVSQTQKYLFVLGQRFFPEVAPQFLIKIQMLIKSAIFADDHFTLLNFVFLMISSISFLNSIWMGVYFVTEDRSILSFWKILKGFVIIGITLLMLAMIFIVPPIIIFVIKFIQTNAVTQFMYESIDFLRPFITYIKKINLKKSYWLHSNTLHISVVIIYFTVLYRWLFSWKISLKEALVASLAFSISVFIGKSLFWIYVDSAREGLIQNYGELYTSMVGLIWVFYLMCFFFYGACVCQIYNQKRLDGVRDYGH